MKTLVIAPHADDELLGCGGTLLRRVEEGAVTGWLLATKICESAGWSAKQAVTRQGEIDLVRNGLGIEEGNFFQLDFSSTQLDQIPTSTLVQKVASVFDSFQPEEVLLPYSGDPHSDHRIVFEAAAACCKTFRYPCIKRVLAYETISETDHSIDPRYAGFRPNVYIDISEHLDHKIDLLSHYASELAEFPFPRSVEAIRSLSKLHGSRASFGAAEAFMLLLDRS